MMRALSLIIFVLLFVYEGQAQRFISNSAKIHFFSSAPMEDIEASSNQCQSIIDISTGDMVFSMNVNTFQFSNSLMQEHFNENYLETDKYPKSTFKAKLDGFKNEYGTHTVSAKGEFMIHGVKQQVEIEGTLNYTEDQIQISAKFPVTLADYKIKIPKAVFYNIAEVIDVTVEFDYEPYQK